MRTALQAAVSRFNLTAGKYNLHDIKSIYHHLASVNHPDHGGNNDKMQEINDAHHELVNYFKTKETLEIGVILVKVKNEELHTVTENWSNMMFGFVKFWYGL